jgi:hypothetical protein
MDREAGGMSKSPKVAIEDGIGLDLEDGHGGCRRLSEGGEGVGNRHWVCRLLFPIGRLSLSKKATSEIYQILHSTVTEKCTIFRRPPRVICAPIVTVDFASDGGNIRAGTD